VLAVNDIWKETVSLREINIVISKWIFKFKLHTDDFLNKLKTKVMIREFLQMYSINYEDIFALTVKFNTLYVFLTLVALKDLECHQINVNNVFTELFLKKTIYTTLFLRVTTIFNCVLHILCSLYDLKQAVRDWHEQYVTELFQLNFHQNNADSCFLIYTVKSIMLLLYVNDIIIISSSLLNVLWFKKFLKSLFKIKNLRETQKILDI